MSDYSQMSDQEINLAAHEATIGYKLHPYGRKTYWYEGKGQQETTELPDYCNSWADAGPIISENKISLHAPSITKTWMAEFTGSDDDVNDGFHVDYFESHHENPLRAAMIVFLMMKDAENANPS